MHSVQYCFDGGVEVDDGVDVNDGVNDGDFFQPVVVDVELCHLVGEVVIHCCDVEHLLKVAEIVVAQQQGYQELSLASGR